MAGTLTDFRSSFRSELARPSRFDVTIPVPPALGVYITSARGLSLRCESTSIPGKTYETVDKKMGSAPVEKFPYHVNYNEVTMNFIVSGDMNEKIFFDAWMELINPTTDYNFQYKQNYAVDITINQYNNHNELTYASLLEEAYPVGVNQLDVDWSSDGYHKLAVTFIYKQWSNNSVTALLQNLKTGLVTGLINDITSV
jgi:hypothetical protein